MEPNDRTRFGKTVKQIRLQKGLTQQDMVDLLDHYAGPSAYRRVENGKRVPERDVAIAILVYGLAIKNKAEIDSHIAQAGYSALTATEVVDLKLDPSASTGDPPPPPRLGRTGPDRTHGMIYRWPALVAVVSSLGVSALLFSTTEYGPWFGLLLSSLYAGLYGVSLLLETAYEPTARRDWVTVSVFCLVLTSSGAACAADAALVRSGSRSGLVLAIIIFAVAAILQAVLSKRALPDYSIVKARVETHSAQAAHLKNTCYFLAIVILFWLPPLHAVSVLRQQLKLGHQNLVRETLSHWVLLGHGIISLNYGWVFALFAAILILAIAMRAQLLDNLRTHPSKNSFLRLFYIRAAVYFTLAGICAVWYAAAIGSLFE